MSDTPSAELDVDAAAGHVGGDRDGAVLAGVLDDRASRSWFLAFSTSCGMPRRSSRWERCSDTSTEIVPTRTGCPMAWRSTMSSTTAENFSSLVR